MVRSSIIPKNPRQNPFLLILIRWIWWILHWSFSFIISPVSIYFESILMGRTAPMPQFSSWHSQKTIVWMDSLSLKKRIRSGRKPRGSIRAQEGGDVFRSLTISILKHGQALPGTSLWLFLSLTSFAPAILLELLPTPRASSAFSGSQDCSILYL